MIDWKNLSSVEQVDDLAERSADSPVVLFKHSTRCSISSMAKHRLEHSGSDVNLEVWYLDLLRYRSVSNYIAEKFGVWHQSPQVIVLKNGEAVYDASHHMISFEELQKQVGV